MKCKTIFIASDRMPRDYMEIIEYENEADDNGEVTSDYTGQNNYWIDTLLYATSPLSMRRGNSA